jgi:hypothetical protein
VTFVARSQWLKPEFRSSIYFIHACFWVCLFVCLVVCYVWQKTAHKRTGKACPRESVAVYFPLSFMLCIKCTCSF